MWRLLFTPISGAQVTCSTIIWSSLCPSRQSRVPTSHQVSEWTKICFYTSSPFDFLQHWQCFRNLQYIMTVRESHFLFTPRHFPLRKWRKGAESMRSNNVTYNIKGLYCTAYCCSYTSTSCTHVQCIPKCFFMIQNSSSCHAEKGSQYFLSWVIPERVCLPPITEHQVLWL